MAFDLAKFRILYPMFADVDDTVVQAVAEQAACYTPSSCGDCLDQLLMLMVAHLLQLRQAAQTPGSGTGQAIASATIGSVSVSMAQPAAPNDRKVWLYMTGFGTQYAALEAKCLARAKAGLFFGGLPEGKAFRRVGGVLK